VFIPVLYWLKQTFNGATNITAEKHCLKIANLDFSIALTQNQYKDKKGNSSILDCDVIY
jgi:hypothetical protein